jgi:hypothetical protein
MYKLLSMDGQIFGAYKEENGVRVSFVFNSDNTDYQAYLAWLELGNVPIPAENT